MQAARRSMTGSVKWETLLGESRFAVVLGTAGLGKTTEFKRRAESLRDQGTPAFHVHISALESKEFRKTQTPDARQEFDNWQSSKTEAFFFVDAFDEGKRGDSDILKHALYDLDELFETPAQRHSAHIVLSSRTNEWRKSDEENLRQALSAFVTDQAEEPPLKIYRLERLTPENTERLVREGGDLDAAEADRFLNVLSDPRCQPFSNRPLDLEWLLEFWQEEGGMKNDKEFPPNRQKLIENNVKNRLQENPDNEKRDNTRLNPDELRPHLERMAATLTLTERPSLDLPSSRQPLENDRARLNLDEILPPEDVPYVKPLPLLKQPVPGEITFHRREISEYLTAQWFHRLVEQGLYDAQDIWKECTVDVDNATVPASFLASTLAWLASFDSEICDLLIENYPDLLLIAGDPCNIPPEKRRKILVRIAEGNEELGERTWLGNPRILKWYADPELEPTVIELIEEGDPPPQLLRALLELAKHAKMTNIVPIAVRLALHKSNRKDVRHQSIETAAAIGEKENLTDLLELPNQAPHGFDSSLAKTYIKSLFPRHIDVDTVCEVLEEFGGNGDNQISNYAGLIDDYVLPNCPVDQLPALMEGVHTILRNDDRRLGNFGWLKGSLGNVIGRILDEFESVALSKQDLVSKLTDLVDDLYHSRHRGIEELREALQGQPTIRREIFWQLFSRLNQEYENGPADVSRYPQIFPPKMFPEDIEWMLNDLADPPVQDAHSALLRRILSVWKSGHQESSDLADRIRHVADKQGLTDRFEAYETGDRPILPAHDGGVETADPDPIHNPTRKEIQTRLRGIREGGVKHLCQNDFQEAKALHRAIQGNAGDSGWLSQSGFRDHCQAAGFSSEQIDQLEQALKRLWEEETPRLPSEGGLKGQAPTEIHPGLTGLQLQIDSNETTVNDFTQAEADRASRYVFYCEADYPSWIARLISSFDVVVENLANIIFERFDKPDYNALRRLSEVLACGSAKARRRVGTLIADRLAPDNREPDDLNRLLKTLVRLDEPVTRESWIEQSRERLESVAGDKSHQESAVWVSNWLLVDADEAAKVLKKKVDRTGEDGAREILLELSSRLYDAWMGFDDPIEAPDYRKPGPLQTLIRLYWHHWMDGHDWSMEPKTPAETTAKFRHELLKKLVEVGDEEAVQTLRNLLQDAPDAKEARTVRISIRRALIRAAESTSEPWSADEIAPFEKAARTPPKTPDELFKFTIHALRRTKRQLEAHPFSVRELFDSDPPESAWQTWLARRLQLITRETFQIFREVEVDLRNRPDLVTTRTHSGTVAIELKRAHKWSFNQLVEALRQQLVGQYLKDEGWDHGILVLFRTPRREKPPKNRWNDSDKRYYWRHEDEEKTLLIPHLNQRAQSIAKQEDGIAGLAVIGIDAVEPAI